jgi:hypothetical protein
MTLYILKYIPDCETTIILGVFDLYQGAADHREKILFLSYWLLREDFVIKEVVLNQGEMFP